MLQYYYRQSVTDCFSASRRIAMTDHFFGGEGGEKEVGSDSAITEN